MADYSKKIDKIIEGLQMETCILFIGPEFMKFNGKDYNSAFYETLPEYDEDEEDEINNVNAKYNEEEKIWSFESKPIQDEFFEMLNSFIKENRNLTDNVYLKLASIPFPLIVSLLPDDTLDAAFKQFENFNYNFKSFFIDHDVPEVTKDNMLIYNLFGNIVHDEFVASHSDYLRFVIETVDVKFPPNLKTAIKKAKYMVFIGFEFDKWYNILLLYILNREKSGSKKYIINEQSTKELVAKLSDSSLKVLFIKDNEFNFINDLYNKAKEKGLLRDILLKHEYIVNKMKRTTQAIDELEQLIIVTESPKEKIRYEMELESLKKENETLTKQLKEINF